MLNVKTSRRKSSRLYKTGKNAGKKKKRKKEEEENKLATQAQMKAGNKPSPLRRKWWSGM